MSMVILQEKLLLAASAIYLVVTVFYIIYLAKRSETLGKAATYIGLAGVILHTLGLVFRWAAAGIDHPPFTNLYESLVFFGWGIVAFYLYMEFRHHVRIAGAFVFPVALAAMFLAVTHQEKGIMPLPDALKSWWLHAHVIFASIAYAAFVVAFAFSLMYLMKDRVKRETFGALSCGVSAFALLLVLLRKGAGHFGVFVMKQMTTHQGELVPVRIESATGGWEYAYSPLPGVGAIFMAAFLLLAAATVIYAIRIFREDRRVDALSGAAVSLATAALSIGILFVFVQSSKVPDVSVTGEPYLLTLLFFLWLIVGGMCMYHYLYDGINERLPDIKKLDFLSYRSVVVAFPLMTIVIVTGAVWAQSAWGRYWGWDPKETASLVTWFVYAIYLHSRVVAGWKGRPAAVISIIGFLSVIFTYLGVNVFLSGLHSYASASIMWKLIGAAILNI